MLFPDIEANQKAPKKTNRFLRVLAANYQATFPHIVHSATARSALGWGTDPVLVSPGTLAAVGVYVWLTYFQFRRFCGARKTGDLIDRVPLKQRPQVLFEGHPID